MLPTVQGERREARLASGEVKIKRSSSKTGAENFGKTIEVPFADEPVASKTASRAKRHPKWMMEERALIFAELEVA